MLVKNNNASAGNSQSLLTVMKVLEVTRLQAPTMPVMEVNENGNGILHELEFSPWVTADGE